MLLRNPELVTMNVSMRAIAAVDIPACFFRFICEIHAELRHLTLGDAEPHVDSDTRLLQKDRPVLPFQSKNSLAYLTRNVKLRRRRGYDGLRAERSGAPLAKSRTTQRGPGSSALGPCGFLGLVTHRFLGEGDYSAARHQNL